MARWREAIVAVKVFNVRGLGGPEEAADPEAPPSPSITLSNPILDVLRKVGRHCARYCFWYCG